MRSGVMSPEIAKEFMKLKYIEDTLSLLQPQCKSEKDLRLIKHFLLHYSAFLAAFAKSEEGQKIILVISTHP